MSSERFHKAARDGALEILKEATRKDCNSRDEGGMTPTLWAAFEGHIDALRLLVARGGDADKTDYFGNTALHLSAARGHEFCVKFLVKFGCNIWSLDIDRHSARELAAINGRDKILQFLDLAQTEQEATNRKKCKMLRKKAEKDAEERLKEYIKRQKTADIRAEKEQKKLLKDRAKMDIESMNENNVLPHRPSILTFKGRVKPSQTFSDIVGTISTAKAGTTARRGSAVCRKALARKAVTDDFKVIEEISGVRNFQIGSQVPEILCDTDGRMDFRFAAHDVGTSRNPTIKEKAKSIEEDGKRSVRSLTGLRRDSEVMYVGTYETQAQQQIGKRGRISDVWGTLSKAQSTPDLLGDRDYDDDDDDENDQLHRSGTMKNVVEEAVLLQEPASIFNRPGFGSVAFRRSITATLDNLPVTQLDVNQRHGNAYTNGSLDGSINGHRNSVNGHNNEEISIGSAGSLARRQSMWDDDRLSSFSGEDETDETDEEWTPLQRFLVANNLTSIQNILEAEQIDLEALMLLTDADIAALKLPLGPRRKLTNAIADRKDALAAPEKIIKDTRL